MHGQAPQMFRLAFFVLLADACSEALTPSRIIRPMLPPARKVALVASLESAASLENAASLKLSSGSAKTPWMEKLNKISNVASILCAIDCTVFPVLLTLLPILNLGSSGKYEVWRRTTAHNHTRTLAVTNPSSNSISQRQNANTHRNAKTL